MRTYKGILSTITGMIFVIITSFLKFVIIKLFILKQGNDLNGLYQLFGQVMAYLNLAEGGIGTALTFSLYKPLQEKNYKKINDILSSAKKVYYGIGLLIFIIGVTISPFLKFFLNSNIITNNKIAFFFILYVIKTTIDYWTNITRFLLQADQKEYILNIISLLFRVIDVAIEYYLLILNFSLFFILLKNIFILLLTNIFITFKTKRNYKWLNLNADKDFSFLKNTKYTFFYSICGAIVYNTDYILLGKYRSLEEITFYANYMYIFSFLTLVLLKGIGSISSGLGNLYAEHNINKLKEVYSELICIVFFVTSISAIGLFFTLEDFIKIWLGKSYILDKKIFYIFILIYIHTMTRQPTGIICNSSGYFRNARIIVIIEMVMNFSISFLLVKQYGILGVLIGTITAHIASNFWMYPKLCFNKIFNCSVWIYFKCYSYYIFISIIIFILTKIIFKNIFFEITTFYLLFKKITILGIFLLISHLIVYMQIKNFRNFLLRIKNILYKKRGEE